MVIPCPSHHKDLVVKCSLARGKDVPVPACEDPCEKLLDCHAHTCDKLCHDGECEKCTAKETVKCFCGAEEREASCGWKRQEESTCGDANSTWRGRYGCERICNRPYDCGEHTCQEVSDSFGKLVLNAELIDTLPIGLSCSSSPDAQVPSFTGYRLPLSLWTNSSGRTLTRAENGLCRQDPDMRPPLQPTSFELQPSLRPAMPRRRMRIMSRDRGPAMSLRGEHSTDDLF